MGRYDFRPLRVRQTAKSLYETKLTPRLPGWYKVLGDIPPGETLARPVMRIPKVRQGKKASKLFKPLPIAYPEDKLRSDFFGDHPWELARPRVILEDSGNDSKGYDWSKITQRGKQLDGESVVQRQMWLMKYKQLSKASAYDQARREFYKHRHLNEVRSRIAKEEALHVGAYFGKSVLEVGMELEDKAWENWKAWAEKEIDADQAMRAQIFSGSEESAETELTTEEEDFALEELSDNTTANTPESKAPLGGAKFHPSP